MLLPPSRTKVNAVHAGLSPPLEPLKVPMPSRLVTSSHSQNNNSLTAQPALATKVVTVVLWTMVSSMPKRTSLNQNLTTHTLLKTANASSTPQRVRSQSLDTRMSPQEAPANSKLLFLLDPFQLPLKLTLMSSNHTALVSSAALLAEPALTTVSSLSDSALTAPPERTTGFSRTHGVATGVKKDSSEFLSNPAVAQVSAVSNSKPHTPLFDLLYYISKH